VAFDGSVSSSVEQWAVDQLTTANQATQGGFTDIGLFDGTFDWQGSPDFTELRTAQTPSAQVGMWFMAQRRDTDRLSDWLATLHVMLATENPRGAESRVGQTDRLGIHGLTELVIETLDDQTPNVANAGNTRFAESCLLDNVAGLSQLKGLWTADVLFTVRIVPTT